MPDSLFYLQVSYTSMYPCIPSNVQLQKQIVYAL